MKVMELWAIIIRIMAREDLNWEVQIDNKVKNEKKWLLGKFYGETHTFHWWNMTWSLLVINLFEEKYRSLMKYRNRACFLHTCISLLCRVHAWKNHALIRYMFLLNSNNRRFDLFPKYQSILTIKILIFFCKAQNMLQKYNKIF